MATEASSLQKRAFAAFATDASSDPPLSLRAGNDIDSYDVPAAFDAALDEPNDGYLERFTCWGLPHIDAPSWRHYLPRLIDYALRRPDDPSMATEALVSSLRPPDRYPPRLASLTPEQEAIITAFLEHVALGEDHPHLREDAQQALEEWWLPGARSRPTAEEVAALRAAPVTYRSVGEDICRLEVPTSLAGSGPRDIPEESRRVETWGGYLCGDAHAVVAVNVTPLRLGSVADAERTRGALFRSTPSSRATQVPGAFEAVRLDGLTGDSPAEPQTLTLVLAANADELVTLTVRAWPRDDVAREVERIVRSLGLVPSPPLNS